MKVGVAGSLESNDVVMTVSESDRLEIEIDSIVKEYFGDQIRKVIEDTLKERNISKIKVKCSDKGALDYTIQSRLITAIERMEESANA